MMDARDQEYWAGWAQWSIKWFLLGDVSKQRLKGNEGVSSAVIWGKVFWAETAASTKA